MPRKRGRPRLDPGIEVDLDNLGADELDELMDEGQVSKGRAKPSLARVAWLERPVIKPTARERQGRA